jgi:hypothetical protein
MKIAQLRKRLQPARPMTTISMRVPEDVIADLKRIAPALGFSGYQPLIRAYVGEGLRNDLERLEPAGSVSSLLASLRRHGVADEVITVAVEEAHVSGAGPSNRALQRNRSAGR